MTSALPYIVRPIITLLYPQGIRFVIADQPGVSLVAIHYSINTQLVGVAGGQYNYDITVRTVDNGSTKILVCMFKSALL